MTSLRRIAVTLAAMSGVVLEHMTALRWAAIAASYAGSWLLWRSGSLTGALLFYAVATLLHYYYLFGMFGQRGGSRTLRQRFGDERGFLVHEALMSFLFCHNALSIVLACSMTSGLALAGLVPALPVWLRIGGAALLIAAGLGVKTWATMLVGVDTYYYRDLFHGVAPGGLQARGPYRWFRDPMYTVGHLQAYGLAVYYNSAWGLLAVVFNQALVLLFNALVEQPHVRNGTPRS